MILKLAAPIGIPMIVRQRHHGYGQRLHSPAAFALPGSGEHIAQIVISERTCVQTGYADPGRFQKAGTNDGCGCRAPTGP